MSTHAKIQLGMSMDAKVLLVRLGMSANAWVRLGISTDAELLKYENSYLIMVQYALETWWKLPNHYVTAYSK